MIQCILKRAHYMSHYHLLNNSSLHHRFKVYLYHLLNTNSSIYGLIFYFYCLPNSYSDNHGSQQCQYICSFDLSHNKNENCLISTPIALLRTTIIHTCQDFFAVMFVLRINIPLRVNNHSIVFSSYLN